MTTEFYDGSSKLIACCSEDDLVRAARIFAQMPSAIVENADAIQFLALGFGTERAAIMDEIEKRSEAAKHRKPRHEVAALYSLRDALRGGKYHP